MLVSKEKFIYYLSKYKEAWEEQKKFHDALRPFFDRPLCTYRESLFDAYEELLVEISECYDDDGIFSWWLIESPNDDKLITVKTPGFDDVEVFDCSSVEGLYNYLCYMYDKKEN